MHHDGQTRRKSLKDEDKRTLKEHEGACLLGQGGIPFVPGELAPDAAVAIRAAAGLGFPVALKVCSEEILHKTESGGVVLNIPDAASLKDALDGMEGRFAGVPHDYLVQKMPSREWSSS